MKVNSPAAPPPAVPAPGVAPESRAPGEWTRGVDGVLAVMAVVVAFLAASVAARNSDLWLSLAGGRLVAEGNLHLGGDPFGDTGRAWVHWAWLGDLVAYGLYTLDSGGGPLVAAKAALVAGAFAAGFLLRRPGRSLAPWAALALLGAAASAPAVAPLRTAAISMLFAPLMLALVVRRLADGALRNRLVELGLFQAVWANADEDFWLGPAIVLLVLIGEVVDRRRAADDASWPAPSLRTLALALGVSLAASASNPWYLAALAADPASALMQVVPVESRLGLPAAGGDTEVLFLTSGPLDGLAASFDRQPVASGGLVALAALGVAAILLAATRARAALVLVWVGSAMLAVLSVKFVPIFAVLGAPVAAGLFNLVAGRSGVRSESAERVAATAGGLGRVLVFALALGLGVLAYPGRLHPRPTDPALAARVEWTLTPDAGLERAAKALGELPPATGATVNSGSAFGNYAAFHAPGRPVFVDGRFRFRRPELADAVVVRRGLVRVTGLAPEAAEAAFREARAVLERRDAGRVALAGSLGASGGRQLDPRPAFALSSTAREWGVARLDGRVAILDKKGVRVDFVKLAFGPNVEPLPVALAVPPPPRDLGLAGEFVTRPQALPPEADDAAVYLGYLQLLARRNRDEGEVASRQANGALGGGTASGFTVTPPPTAEEVALATLALRSARRAVAIAPDRAEGYVQLAEAYAQPLAPVFDESPILRSLQVTERVLQRIAALRRYFDRVTLPATASRAEGFDASRLALILSELYEQSNQFDDAKEMTDLGAEYLGKLPPETAAAVAAVISGSPPDADPAEVLEAVKKSLEARQDQLRQRVQQSEDAAARETDKARQFDALQGMGLSRTAVALAGAYPEAFAARGLAGEVTTTLLNLRAGRVDAVATYIGGHRDAIEAELARAPDAPLVQALSAARGILARLVGDTPAARQAVPAPAFPRPPAGLDPERPTLARLGPASALVGFPILVAASLGDPGTKVPLFEAVNRDQAAIAQLRSESLLAQDRATLALVEGRVAEAQALFGQAAAPQGVAIARIGDGGRAAVIRTYSALIARAEK